MSGRTHEPDLDAEQEVDFGRYGRAIAARWWLPLLGLVIGAIVGYLISLGGAQVFKASATVYLGQPYSVIGSVPLQGPQTNPATVGTIVHSEQAVETAAAAAGLKPDELRGKISSRSISAGAGATNATKTTANPLVSITVQARSRRKARIAANSLANQVVTKLSPYADAKIANLKQRVTADRQEIDGIKRQAAGGSDPTAKAVFAVQLGQILQDQLSAKQLLIQAQQLERAQVLTNAIAVRTTARSRRNSVVVAAFLGVVLGLVAALLWDRLLERRR